MAENPQNNAAPSQEEVSLRRRFFNYRTLISFVIAFGILFLVFERLDVDFSATWAMITSCNPLFYALAFFSYYLSFPLRALRWRLLLHNAGFRKEQGVELPSLGGLTQIILINWFVNSILYARLGDAYRAYLLKQNADVSFSKTIGVVLSERVIDVIVVFILIMVAIFALLLSGSPGMRVVGLVLVLGIAMLLAIAVLLGVMGRFGRSLERRLPRRVKSIYTLFEEGTLGSFGQHPRLGLLSLGIWLLEAGRLLLVIQSLGFDIFEIGLPLILFAALANALITAIPLTPGGLGLVEPGVAVILMIALAKESAWSITLVDRTISFLSVIFIGLPVFVFWHLMRARKRRG
ncbi:MAG: flippase-like domain-containing protein [Dehalococcoidia bacterium]|nr:flippase-like domain-containing protein [Dehalococcoidia bacterium]